MPYDVRMVHEIERDLGRIRYPSLRGCISDFERHSCSLPNLKRVVARNVERLQTVTHDETPRSLGIRTQGPGENPATKMKLSLERSVAVDRVTRGSSYVLNSGGGTSMTRRPSYCQIFFPAAWPAHRNTSS